MTAARALTGSMLIGDATVVDRAVALAWQAFPAFRATSPGVPGLLDGVAA